VLSSTHDLVILLEGVNDLNGVRPVSSIAASLARMVQTAHARGVRVILSTLLPVVPDLVRDFYRVDPALVRQLNAQIREIARREAAVLVDLYVAFGGDVPNLALLSPDGLHPTDAGYQRMTGVFYDAIRRSFELLPPP
jgi:lysophospholipase L1-like esterase